MLVFTPMRPTCPSVNYSPLLIFTEVFSGSTLMKCKLGSQDLWEAVPASLSNCPSLPFFPERSLSSSRTKQTQVRDQRTKAFGLCVSVHQGISETVAALSASSQKVRNTSNPVWSAPGISRHPQNLCPSLSSASNSWSYK